MQVYKVIGVMSGTSLDGLDIAYCELIKEKSWKYKIGATATITYSEKQKMILKRATLLTGEELTALDVKFGKYIGVECKKFIIENKLDPDFISSHGHTVFHKPAIGVTLQIGNGAQIFAKTGLPVVCDFRTQDVALGGQGAPLVPIGDQLLFNDFFACINIGGFANISTQYNKNRIAWDICPVNVVLNYYAKKKGFEFDDGGKLARSGKFHEKLFSALNSISYYSAPSPKSLGIEWVQENIWPLLIKYNLSAEDILHTYVCHIAQCIGVELEKSGVKNVLITGGGVYNDFLIAQIKLKTKALITIPDDKTIQFKEALIFAFLAVLKYRGEVNVLKSVTGSTIDHCSGVIYGNYLLLNNKQK